MTSFNSNDPTDETNEPRGLAGAIASGIPFLWDGSVRKWYQIQTGNIDMREAGATFKRDRLKVISYRKLTPIAKAITDEARKHRKNKLLTKTSIELQKSANITNGAWNRIAKYARGFGYLIIVISFTRTIYVIAHTPKGERIQKTLSILVPTVAACTGSYLGGKATGLIISRTLLSSLSLAPVIAATVGTASGLYLGIGIGSWVVRQWHRRQIRCPDRLKGPLPCAPETRMKEGHGPPQLQAV